MLDPTGERRLQPVGSHKLLSNEVRIKDGGMEEEGLIEVGKWLGSQGAAGEPGRSHSEGATLTISSILNTLRQEKRKYKKENCEEQERLSDGETDRNKEL